MPDDYVEALTEDELKLLVQGKEPVYVQKPLQKKQPEKVESKPVKERGLTEMFS